MLLPLFSFKGVTFSFTSNSRVLTSPSSVTPQPFKFQKVNWESELYWLILANLLPEPSYCRKLRDLKIWQDRRGWRFLNSHPPRALLEQCHKLWRCSSLGTRLNIVSIKKATPPFPYGNIQTFSMDNLLNPSLMFAWLKSLWIIVFETGGEVIGDLSIRIFPLGFFLEYWRFKLPRLL